MSQRSHNQFHGMKANILLPNTTVRQSDLCACVMVHVGGGGSLDQQGFFNLPFGLSRFSHNYPCLFPFNTVVGGPYMYCNEIVVAFLPTASWFLLL